MHRKTDRLAQEAARHIASGTETDAAAAIRRCAMRRDHRGVPHPSPARVHRHVQGMLLQANGDGACASYTLSVLAQVEEYMSSLEYHLPSTRTWLVGRVADGYVDPATTIHIRVYSDIAIGEIAALLEEFCDGETRIESVRTRRGWRERLAFQDHGHRYVLTRCHSDEFDCRDRHLFQDKAIPGCDPAALRNRIDGTGSE